MRTRFLAVPTITAAIACAAVFALPATASTGGSDGWGNALEVPGTAALNTGGLAQANVISCPSAGNCVAGGIYTAGRSTPPFVASEINGTWHNATKLASSVGSAYSVVAVSCATAGNCTIAVNTTTTPVVASEVKGTWHTAEPIPGVSSFGYLTALSCSAPGDCSAGGTSGSDNTTPMFLASEVNGVWGKAIPVPGEPSTEISSIDAISCPSPGNCTASGFDKQFNSETFGVPFVVDEVHGVWHKSIRVPGTSAFPYGDALTVSCASAGNCGVGGYNMDANFNSKAFVATEVHGVWGKAIEVAGALNTGGQATVNSISCPTAGNCTATGGYNSASGNPPSGAFVVSEVNGTWRQAEIPPGIVALSKDGSAQGNSVSCHSPGNCAVGGGYVTPTAPQNYPFFSDEVNGAWHTAVTAPGLSTLSGGESGGLDQVSCGAPGNCSAAGYYNVPKSTSKSQAFVISRP